MLHRLPWPACQQCHPRERWTPAAIQGLAQVQGGRAAHGPGTTAHSPAGRGSFSADAALAGSHLGIHCQGSWLLQMALARATHGAWRGGAGTEVDSVVLDWPLKNELPSLSRGLPFPDTASSGAPFRMPCAYAAQGVPGAGCLPEQPWLQQPACRGMQQVLCCHASSTLPVTQGAPSWQQH